MFETFFISLLNGSFYTILRFSDQSFSVDHSIVVMGRRMPATLVHIRSQWKKISSAASFCLERRLHHERLQHGFDRSSRLKLFQQPIPNKRLQNGLMCEHSLEIYAPYQVMKQVTYLGYDRYLISKSATN